MDKAIQADIDSGEIDKANLMKNQNIQQLIDDVAEAYERFYRRICLDLKDEPKDLTRFQNPLLCLERKLALINHRVSTEIFGSHRGPERNKPLDELSDAECLRLADEAGEP